MAKIIPLSDLNYGDLFVRPEEPGRRFLCLSPYGLADVSTGHIYEAVWPPEVRVIEHIPPLRGPARVNAREKRFRGILGIVASMPREGVTTRDIWRRSQPRMPSFRSRHAFQAALTALTTHGLVCTARVTVEQGYCTHWEDGYRATGPGLLQAVRWRRAASR